MNKWIVSWLSGEESLTISRMYNAPYWNQTYLSFLFLLLFNFFFAYLSMDSDNKICKIKFESRCYFFLLNSAFFLFVLICFYVLSLHTNGVVRKNGAKDRGAPIAKNHKVNFGRIVKHPCGWILSAQWWGNAFLLLVSTNITMQVSSFMFNRLLTPF